MTRDREQSKKRIVSAAVALFHESHDVRKVSVEEIAHQAGVSPATVYHNFGNREALLLAVLKELSMQNLEASKAALRSDLPFPQKLQQIMSGKLSLASRIGDKLLSKLMKQEQGLAPFLEELYQKEVKLLWKEFVQDGQRQGYIEPDLSLDALLIYLQVLKDGFSVHPELVEAPGQNLKLLLELSQIMFYGFLRRDVPLFDLQRPAV